MLFGRANYETQGLPEIADAKPSKGVINLFGGLSIFTAFGNGKGRAMPVKVNEKQLF